MYHFFILLEEGLQQTNHSKCNIYQVDLFAKYIVRIPGELQRTIEKKKSLFSLLFLMFTFLKDSISSSYLFKPTQITVGFSCFPISQKLIFSFFVFASSSLLNINFYLFMPLNKFVIIKIAQDLDYNDKCNTILKHNISKSLLFESIQVVFSQATNKCIKMQQQIVTTHYVSGAVALDTRDTKLKRVHSPTKLRVWQNVNIQTSTTILYQSVSTQETKNHIKYNRRNLMQGILRWVIGEVRNKQGTSG